jgi:hypothetical protein
MIVQTLPLHRKTLWEREGVTPSHLLFLLYDFSTLNLSRFQHVFTDRTR